MLNMSRSKSGMVAIAALVAVGALGTQSAFAQGGRSYLNGANARATYYQLPSVIRVTPGMARILRPRCDGNYPMHESMPCGTATGGPVGGMGS